MEQQTIRIIIVDDHPVVLQGFAFMLQGMEGFDLVGKFSDARAALAFVRQQPVDIVLLDINLPDANGIDICAAVRASTPDCKVIAISNINEHSIIQRMFEAGASGYLLKNASAEEVVLAIRSVFNGGVGLSRSVHDILQRARSGELPVITRREKEVLVLLSEGLSSPEIGNRIFISPLTVESHRRNLLQKFKVSNVAALVRKATELKYI